MILQIDASALRSAGCIRHFYLTLTGYKEKWIFNDIEYGSAAHIFLEARALGKSQEESKVDAIRYYCTQQVNPKFVSKPTRKYLTPLHLDSVMEKLNKEMTDGILNVTGMEALVDRNGQRIIESTFAIPLLTYEDIECLIVGTIDLLGIAKATKRLCLLNDYKTTSFTRKDEYLRSYVLAAQLRMYQLAIKLQAALQPGSFWDELWNNYRFGGVITGIFLNELSCETQRSDIMFLDTDDLIQFEENLRRRVTELCSWIKVCERSGQHLPPREGIITAACEKKFAPCLFAPVCCNNDETAWQMVNAGGFERVDYQPMMFRRQ